jgi:hypothetical protein
MYVDLLNSAIIFIHKANWYGELFVLRKYFPWIRYLADMLEQKTIRSVILG